MKLTYKGICDDFEKLEKNALPENAVKFNEPDTTENLMSAMVVYLVPAFIFIGVAIAASYLIHGYARSLLFPLWSFFLGIVLSIPAFFVHEFLHAICCGKNSVVDFYISPKNFSMFVVSATPVSKRRFIWLSLCPNIFLGWIPLIIWTIFPLGRLDSALFLFAAILTVGGVGDYLNTVNAIRQMPKGSYHLHSGMNSYWFMP